MHYILTHFTILIINCVVKSIFSRIQTTLLNATSKSPTLTKYGIAQIEIQREFGSQTLLLILNFNLMIRMGIFSFTF